MKVVAVVLGDMPSCCEKNKRTIGAARSYAGQDLIEVWSLSKWENKTFALPDCVLSQITEKEYLLSGSDYAALLFKKIESSAPKLVLFPGGMLTNEIAARLARRNNGVVLPEVTSLTSATDGWTAEREVYGYNLNASFRISEKPAFVTLAEGYPIKPFEAGLITEQKDCLQSDTPKFEPLTREEKVQDEGIADAKILLVCGRGVSKQGIAQLQSLCKKLNAALGATRAAIMDGKMPESAMVGISGVKTKAEITVVFGASGAVAFMKGVCGSKLLVAVNQDSNASIFQYCDVGVVQDCHKIINELTNQLQTLQ